MRWTVSASPKTAAMGRRLAKSHTFILSSNFTFTLFSTLSSTLSSTFTFILSLSSSLSSTAIDANCGEVGGATDVVVVVVDDAADVVEIAGEDDEKRRSLIW